MMLVYENNKINKSIKKCNEFDEVNWKMSEYINSCPCICI